jgi:hypothetical protein
MLYTYDLGTQIYSEWVYIQQAHTGHMHNKDPEQPACMQAPTNSISSAEQFKSNRKTHHGYSYTNFMFTPFAHKDIHSNSTPQEYVQ